MPGERDGCPYVGLTSYDAEDARFFFGREVESDVIRTNLIARRLTLLYGPSGVGKSSVLRAGVLPLLKESSGDDGPRFASVILDKWTADPVTSLLDMLPGGGEEASGRSLDVALTERAQVLGTEFLIILDQFEEYFLYRDEHADRFGEELARAIERSEARAHFLISIREDSLAQLDPFKRRLPRLFASTLRISQLSRDDGRRAIEGPIEEYNRTASTPVAIEPSLVSAVLDQVDSDQVALDDGRVHASGSTGIETPYLQLVMARLWDEEAARGSPDLRLRTFDELGGARRIARDHLDSAINDLSARDREVAASAFPFLVTSGGAKIAQSPEDLAGFTGEPASTLRSVLEQLASGRHRILRTVAGADGAGRRYELFHDVLANPVLDLRNRLAERRARRERRRARLALAAAGVFLLLAAFAVAVSVLAIHQKHQADAARKLALAGSLLGAARDAPLDEAILLDLQADRGRPTGRTRSALSASVQRVEHLDRLLPGAAGFRGLSFSDDGSRLATTEVAEGRVNVWDAATGKRTATVRAKASLASLNADGTALATVVNDRVSVWDLRHPGARPRPLQLPAAAQTHLAGGVAAIAFTGGGGTLTAVVRGLIARWSLGDGSVRTFHLPADVAAAATAFAVSPRGDVASVGTDRLILWTRSGGRRLSPLTSGSDYVSAVAFGDGGRVVGAVSARGRVAIWNVASGRLVLARALAASVSRAKLLALGRRVGALAVGWSSGDVDVWSDVRAPAKTTLHGHPGALNDLAFSSDGGQLATSGEEGVVALWSPWRANLTQSVPPPPGDALLTDLAVGGSTAAAASFGSVYVWASLDRRPLRYPVGNEQAASMAVTPDGRFVVLALGDRVRLLDARQASHVERIASGRHAIAAVAAGPGTIAWGTDAGVTLWDTERKRVVRFAAIPHVAHLAVSPDGQFVAATTTDGAKAFVVGRRGGSKTLPSVPGAAVAFGRGGLVAITGPHGIALVNGETGKRIGSFTTVAAQPIAVAFSPDGQTLAATVNQGNQYGVVLEDVKQRVVLGDVLQGLGGTNGLGFTAGGRFLVAGTGGSDTLVKVSRMLWDDAAMRARLCAVVDRNLTDAEWHDAGGSGAAPRTCARPASSR